MPRLCACCSRISRAWERRPTCCNATRPAVAPRRFDLVFLDAPYDSGASAPTLHALTTGDWLAPNAWLAVETSRAEVLEHADLTTVAEKAYGKAKITLLRAPG